MGSRTMYLNRVHESASAERAARAEERKNEEEKSAWHKQQIEDCNKKIESVNCRKTELDDLKSRLFAELKEVVAKDKAQKASLSQQSTLSQAKEKHEPEASVDSSTTNVNAQQLDQLLDSAFDEIAADSSADNFFGADMLFVNEQLKMLCGDLMSSSEELLINSDYDENVPPNIQRASDWAIASVHEKNLPALKAGQVIAESDEKGHAVEQQTYGLTFTDSLKERQYARRHVINGQMANAEKNFLLRRWVVPTAIVAF
ncbi:hypothetical protein Tcan_09343 [Toxocara canis]|uniref:Uncharacterized protein n=1 Tax=Toxocara canis TaxID=6265 RepID=A0A0B2UVJ6_TOXCA|nr:hypothetical protein Tcan_09343 [Toxocara canis]